MRRKFEKNDINAVMDIWKNENAIRFYEKNNFIITRENMDKNTGIGLKNMQDRVQALNGTLRIEGEKGFRIFAMIPKEMPKEKENN